MLFFADTLESVFFFADTICFFAMKLPEAAYSRSFHFALTLGLTIYRQWKWSKNKSIIEFTAVLAYQINVSFDHDDCSGM
jgi:hypothetical protein